LEKKAEQVLLGSEGKCRGGWGMGGWSERWPKQCMHTWINA
jgi:hypothetical protein